MTNQQLLTADVLDILFEHRNKLYGAYYLRRTYPYTLGKSLMVTLFSIILLLLIVKPKTNFDNTHRLIIIDPVAPINIPKEKKVIPPSTPLPPPAVHKQIKQKIWVNKIKIVDNKEWKQEDMPRQEDLVDAAISNQNVTGDTSTNAHQPAIVETKTAGPDIGAEKNKEPFIAVEQEPEFPGGQKAWLDFLSRNLHTPAELQTGERKTVVVQFLVDEEGGVTHFEILQSGGTAFDNEVIRVLKKMPHWKPAIQNGHKTAVSFTQPVTFISSEE